MSDEGAGREAQIASGLSAVRERIAAACHGAGRATHEVRLVVVTKTFPASDVRILAALGCTDVGENRDQEARAKRAELGPAADAVRWHMIGQLQRNKARSVAQWADVVESVDRVELAEALSRAAVSVGRRLDALVQVSLDARPDAGRGGADPLQVPALARAMAALPGLRLAGVMAVAPHPGDPDEAFARLAEVAQGLRPLVDGELVVSAGMSDDLEQAVAHGATQVRIGGAILGNRSALG